MAQEVHGLDGDQNRARERYDCIAMATDHTDVAPSCANHPGVETRLTCSSCGKPICPRCMVSTAVGQKCPDCARQTRRARGTPPTAILARVLVVTLASGAVAAVLLRVIPLGGFLASALYGFVVGALAGWAARGRRHPLVGLVAAAGLVCGVAVTLILLGRNPLAGPVLVLYLIGGGIAYTRAAGVW
jgi:B-box zinc finger